MRYLRGYGIYSDVELGFVRFEGFEIFFESAQLFFQAVLTVQETTLYSTAPANSIRDKRGIERF